MKDPLPAPNPAPCVRYPSERGILICPPTRLSKKSLKKKSKARRFLGISLNTMCVCVCVDDPPPPSPQSTPPKVYEKIIGKSVYQNSKDSNWLALCPLPIQNDSTYKQLMYTVPKGKIYPPCPPIPPFKNPMGKNKKRWCNGVTEQLTGPNLRESRPRPLPPIHPSKTLQENIRQNGVSEFLRCWLVRQNGVSEFLRCWLVGSVHLVP